MKFSVGYQLAETGEESFVEIVREFREHVAEVYFAWVGQPSGRSPIGGREGEVDPQAVERFEADLAELRRLGVKLDLLFNANCYGGEGIAKALEARVVGTIERAAAVAGSVETVTTTSPAIAHIVRKHFPNVRTRASVNLRIGTVEAMKHVAHLFDAYHVQRDYNRDLGRLRTLRQWADGAGKTLSILLNSGCLRFCAAQTFHDNLVAHETAVARSDNLDDFLPYACWTLLRDRANWPLVLQATWVRPEDLHHYDGLFDVGKLATRLHQRPHAVIRAYAQRRFRGNLLDLMEPGYSPAFAPWVIDNERIPGDFFDHVSACGGQCHRCDYCAAVLEQALRKIDV
ncbi:MAG TPA: hypothetical protein DCX07_07660 [Phycisphaerales bacterium]|nr:hypothetical protein [Phycisphaerales bacterium]